MMQIFLDSNVWFDYCWTKNNNKRPRKKNYLRISKINSKKAKVILTDPLVYEISSLFRERFLIKRAFEQGISVFETRRIKREFSLRYKDRNRVDKILEKYVYSLSVSKDQWLVDWLDQNVLSEVFRITSIYDIEFIDCLHIIASLVSQCDLFVTRDERLINGFRKASKRRTSFRRLTVITPSEFLSKYEKTLFKK